jgi:hypothetical protein
MRGSRRFGPETDAIRGAAFHHGDMSAATINPGPVHPTPHGATGVTSSHHRHRLGDALRAVKVFADAALDVVLLGEYGEEAGVLRR